MSIRRFNRYSKIASMLLGAISLILISACSTDPSESDARKVFEDHWKDNIKNEEFKIISFKRGDAKIGEGFGMKIYIMKYEAEIKYLKGPQKGEIEKIKGEIIFRKAIGGDLGWMGEIYR
jgi:hypothetical protein